MLLPRTALVLSGGASVNLGLFKYIEQCHSLSAFYPRFILGLPRLLARRPGSDLRNSARSGDNTMTEGVAHEQLIVWIEVCCRVLVS